MLTLAWLLWVFCPSAAQACGDQLYLDLAVSVTPGQRRPLGIALGASYRGSPSEGGALRTEYGAFFHGGWTGSRGLEFALGPVIGAASVWANSCRYLPKTQADLKLGPALVVPLRGQRAEGERGPLFGTLVQAGAALSPSEEISGMAARVEVGVLAGKALPLLPTFEIGVQLGMLPFLILL